MSQRTEKINSLLQEQLAEIFQKELSLKPSVFVSIPKVDTSADLSYARVFLSVYPEAEKDYVSNTLKKEIGKIQKTLNQQLEMKIIPRVLFEIDNTQEKVDELEDIFKQIREEREDED